MNNVEQWVVSWLRDCRVVERVVVSGRHAVGEYAAKKLGELSAETKQNILEFLEDRPLTSKRFLPQTINGEGFSLFGYQLEWVRVQPLFKAK